MILSSLHVPQLPIIELFVEDSAYLVRRAVAASLPEIVKSIADLEQRSAFAVRATGSLVGDDSEAVQQAILEVMGPLIHAFAGHVPEPLVDAFLGVTSKVVAAPSSQPATTRFAPLVPAFAAALSPPTHANVETGPSDSWDPAKDNERAIISAYNLPGVLLSLGARGWPRLRSLHLRLVTRSAVSQARYLIASSIHDVARLIGPEQALEDLVSLLELLSKDEDPEVTLRVFERFSDFVTHLPDAGLVPLAEVLVSTWHRTSMRDWRLREVLAESLAGLAQRAYGLDDALRIAVELLPLVLRDTISSVRVWGAQVVSASQHQKQSCGPENVLKARPFTGPSPLAIA